MRSHARLLLSLRRRRLAVKRSDGVSGGCPNCGLLLIRMGDPGTDYGTYEMNKDFMLSMTFGYAQQKGAQIVEFDFTGPTIDPTKQGPGHYCLLAVIDSDQDHVGAKTKPPVPPNDFTPDYVTPTDNNVTHRNIKVVDITNGTDFADYAYVSNPKDQKVQAMLKLRGPKCWSAGLSRFKFDKPFWLKPREQVLVQVRVSSPCDSGGDMTIRQETLVGNQTFIGGMTYRLRRAKR